MVDNNINNNKRSLHSFHDNSFIRFQLQLTTAPPSCIKLVLRKLLSSLALTMSIVGQQATLCQTSSLSSATTITSQWQTPVSATIDEYVSIYLFILCLLPLQLQSNLLSLFVLPNSFYHYQRCQHVLYQHLRHHDVLPPSKCNRSTTVAVTITAGT